jgi:membrane associated rhomboid family serine protease
MLGPVPPPRTTLPGPAPRLVARAPATLAIVAANVAAFVWIASRGPITTATLVGVGALERGRVWSGQAWRLLSAAFVHGQWSHLALNALGLLIAGPMLEATVGPARFLALFAASAVAGSSLSLLGQDAVAAGASGGLFGVIGALLVLHLRALGGWRPFARSPATLWVAGGLAASFVGALSWPFVGDTDHLAHVGGLVAGVLVAWAEGMTPPRRTLARGAVVATLAALAGGAAWPRASPTRFEGEEAAVRVAVALRAADPAGARALLARAEARGLRSDALEYCRALLLVQEGDPEGALTLLDRVASTAEEPLRDEVLERGAAVARMLGYRYYTGDGRARDPVRGLAYFQTSCRLGDDESCRYVDAIAGRPRTAGVPHGVDP